MATYRRPGCHIAQPEFPSEVGFVFICPGRYEEKAGKPCAGQTGVMLESALPHLCERMPGVFSSPERLNYLITNAWPQVEYKAKTGRSVPTESEVLLLDNVEGLYHEIESLRYVVACGNLAHAAITRCQQVFELKAVVARVSHTSRQALGCPTNANLPIRLKQWASSVIRQF